MRAVGRETEPGALVGRLGHKERLAQLASDLGRDAGAVVAHPDFDRFAFAEAILNRTPWRMWDLRTGEPAPGAGTLEAREVLESTALPAEWYWDGERLLPPGWAISQRA